MKIVHVKLCMCTERGIFTFKPNNDWWYDNLKIENEKRVKMNIPD